MGVGRSFGLVVMRAMERRVMEVHKRETHAMRLYGTNGDYQDDDNTRINRYS